MINKCFKNLSNTLKQYSRLKKYHPVHTQECLVI